MVHPQRRHLHGQRDEQIGSNSRTLFGVDTGELGTEEVWVWERLALLDILCGDKDLWNRDACCCQGSRRISARGRCTNGPTGARSVGDLQEMRTSQVL